MRPPCEIGRWESIRSIEFTCFSALKSFQVKNLKKITKLDYSEVYSYPIDLLRWNIKTMTDLYHRAGRSVMNKEVESYPLVYESQKPKNRWLSMRIGFLAVLPYLSGASSAHLVPTYFRSLNSNEHAKVEAVPYSRIGPTTELSGQTAQKSTELYRKTTERVCTPQLVLPTTISGPT